MKNHLYFLFVISLIVGCSKSEDNIITNNNYNPINTWEYSNGSNNDDESYSVEETFENGYIITGFTKSSGSDDVLVTKLDSNGVKIWTKTYGGQKGNSIKKTNDGGYIIVGNHGYNNGNIYLVKINSLGDLEWSNTYGGSNENSNFPPSLTTENGYDVEQTNDGGYIILGSTETQQSNNNTYVVKVDQNGVLKWTKLIPGSGGKIEKTSDNGFIICNHEPTGSLLSSYNIKLTKTTNSGIVEWSNYYGGFNEVPDYSYDVKQTNDGGFVILGKTYPFFSNGSSIIIIKTDNDGTQEWEWEWEKEVGFSIKQTNDGGYIVTGREYRGNTYDLFLMKFNSVGFRIWTKYYGQEIHGNNYTTDEYGHDVLQTHDGGYVITGYSKNPNKGNDIYVVKTDQEGNLNHEK